MSFEITSEKLVVAHAANFVLKTNHLEELSKALKGISFPQFYLSKTLYTFDNKKLFEAVEEYVENMSEIDLAVGDLQEFDFFTRVSKDDRMNDHAMIPSIYALVNHDKSLLDWPVQKILPGLTIVLGGRGAGKTTYLLEEKELDVLIRLNEPMEHVDDLGEVYQATSVTNAISVAIFLSLLGLKVAIDSFKSLVYGLEGAALSGGMSSGVFDFMTTVNNLVANFGTNIVVTVNPMDPDKVDRTFDMLAASVTGTVLIANYNVQSATYRLSDGRVSESGIMANGNTADSYEHVGPNRPVSLPEKVGAIVDSPLSRSLNVDVDDLSPRVGGKINL